MNMHRRRKQRRAPSNGIPLAPRGSRNWGEIGWWCLSVIYPLREKIKLMYFPGRGEAHHHHQRNVIVEVIREHFYFFIWFEDMSFPEKGREIVLLSCTKALLGSSKSLLLAPMTWVWVIWDASQPSRAPLAGYRPDTFGCHMRPLCFTFGGWGGSACVIAVQGFFWTIFWHFFGQFFCCLSVEMETLCLASRAGAAFTLWHIPGCLGTFLRALSFCVLQITVYISSDLCWTRWAALRFHKGV